ncbi:Zinc transporter [Coemansia spiralis]|nr:Zinc transporter [Coemansia spiralis]
MASSTSQAWLYAMTSGLASALGGAALYVDPLLHLCGVPRRFNLLDSHMVLCVVLATASGAMAYTSIGVMTRESIDYLSDQAIWPAVRRHAGATAAGLFIAGALFNLLLARAIEMVTPKDSPIKHACASHPPSSSRPHTGAIGGSGFRRHASRNEHQPLLLPGESTGAAAGPVARECGCEYACTSPRCYSLEHCHITPLFPHVHAHGPDSEQVADGPHRRHGGAACSGGAGSSEPGAVHRAHIAHNGHGATDMPGPGAAHISRRHRRLLIHVGLQTAVAIGLHKIPEGLIIFLSRQASPRLGLSVAASLFFHNLPEGLMLALPLFLATGRRHAAFGVAALLGAAPPAVGAALGMLVVGDAERRGGRLPGVFGVAFGVIAGMLCMVALNGMLPTARIYDKTGNTVACCFAIGVAAMLFANTSLE